MDAPPEGDGSFALEHLRNWAEKGPDLPERRPPQPTPTTAPPEETDIRAWESKDEIIKGNQVIARLEEGIGVVTLGIGDGVTKQELTTFLNQILPRGKTYFIYVEDARLKDKIAELYRQREIVAEGSMANG